MAGSYGRGPGAERRLMCLEDREGVQEGAKAAG